MRKILSTTAAAILALAACGGDDGDAGASTAASTRTTTTLAPTTTAVPSPNEPSTTRARLPSPTTTIPVARDTKIAALACTRDLLGAALALKRSSDYGVDDANASCDEAELLLKVDQGTGAKAAHLAISEVRVTMALAVLQLVTDGVVSDETAELLFDQGFNIESIVSADLGIA